MANETTMKVGGINFNIAEIKSYATADEFVTDYGKRRCVTEKQLREAHASVNGAAAPTKEPKTPKPTTPPEEPKTNP